MTPEISFKVVTFGQTVKEHYTFIFFQACEWAESSQILQSGWFRERAVFYDLAR